MANILPEGERLKKYTAQDYYLPTRWIENQSWHKKTLRSDQLAAIGYSLGYKNYAEVCNRLKKFGISRERMKDLPNVKYDALVKELESGKQRTPRVVVDVGCGRGELLLAYHLLGVECVGIDPSPGAKELVPKTMAWGNVKWWEFINKGLLPGLQTIHRKIDTVIMCESIEHIREGEFKAGWQIICEKLSQTSGMFIVVNWINYHPIPIDRTGYDHIRRIDNPFYDRLSVDAKNVIFRRGSHLVLEF